MIKKRVKILLRCILILYGGESLQRVYAPACQLSPSLMIQKRDRNQEKRNFQSLLSFTQTNAQPFGNFFAPFLKQALESRIKEIDECAGRTEEEAEVVECVNKMLRWGPYKGNLTSVQKEKLYTFVESLPRSLAGEQRDQIVRTCLQQMNTVSPDLVISCMEALITPTKDAKDLLSQFELIEKILTFYLIYRQGEDKSTQDALLRHMHRIMQHFKKGQDMVDGLCAYKALLDNCGLTKKGTISSFYVPHLEKCISILSRSSDAEVWKHAASELRQKIPSSKEDMIALGVMFVQKLAEDFPIIQGLMEDHVKGYLQENYEERQLNVDTFSALTNAAVAVLQTRLGRTSPTHNIYDNVAVIPDVIAQTIAQGRTVRIVRTTRPTYFKRLVGEHNTAGRCLIPGEQYQEFFTQDGLFDEQKARFLSAVRPEWNPMTYAVDVVIPAGAILIYSYTSAMGEYKGGGIQVFLAVSQDVIEEHAAEWFFKKIPLRKLRTIQAMCIQPTTLSLDRILQAA